MKKSRIKVILTVCALALVLFSLSGCADILNTAFGTKWTFDNYTSYAVEFTNVKSGSGTNASPSSFIVPAWGEYETYVLGDTISYTYDHASVVQIVQTSSTTLRIQYK